MKDIIPILYYSPAIMNQIFSILNNGIISSETQFKKNTFGAKLNFIVEVLFSSTKGEANFNTEHSRENTIIKNHDDFTRAIDSMSKIKKLKLDNFSTSDNSMDSIFLLNGNFSIQQKRSLINKETFIMLQHNEDELIVRSTTSIKNWISDSLLNQVLFSGNLNATAIVIPLSISENVVDVKIACLFKYKE